MGVRRTRRASTGVSSPPGGILVNNAPQPVGAARLTRNLSGPSWAAAELWAVADDVNDWLAGIVGSAERLTDGLAKMSSRLDLGADAEMATIAQDVVGITRAAAGALDANRRFGRRRAPRTAARFRSTSGGARSGLGARELEVVRLMAGGMSNKAVAEELHISLNTVRNHVQHILYKLEVHSKLAAVAAALGDGMIEQARPTGPPGRRKGANASSPAVPFPSMHMP
jgi:DNA-binding CsgD family transcriptional regulator